MSNRERSNDGPMTLAQARQLIEAEGLPGLLQTLESRATGAGHNAVIAADFSVASSTGPLAGIPIGVKDNIDVAGFATTGGSPALKDYRPGADAPAVTALRQAGAILCCKLNMHELAFGVTTDNATFGRVFNPFDNDRTAGGSSGGSGAAVARGIVPVALGTDTGGSVRIPASFCGVAGFRPSTGRYPTGGVLPLSQMRDTIGVIAATVADLCEVDADLVRRYEAFRDHGRAALQRRVSALYTRFGIDAIVMPTAVVQPPRWEEAETMRVTGGERPTFFTVVHYTALATLIGAPSLSLERSSI